MSEKSIVAKGESDREAIRQARQLRLAVVTNVWRQGLLTDDQAREILRGRLVPTDALTVRDDSHLLGVDSALHKIY